VSDDAGDESEDGGACHVPHTRAASGWQWLALIGGVAVWRRFRRLHTAR
jgi:hypothetical protein